MNLRLITFSNNLCTLGKLYDDQDNLICNTMEKPWKDNTPSISCVPAGTYELNKTNSPKFGQTYCLENKALNVSLSGDTARTHILIHKANKETQLLGCIAPVSYFGVLHSQWAGLSSKVAYDKLMSILGDENHTLEIARY